MTVHSVFVKRIALYVLALSLLLPAGNISAQRSSGEAIISASVGLNIFNFIMEAVSDSLITTSTPTFTFTYDYGLARSFSIGAAVSYYQFSFINPHYSYVKSPGVIVYENISVKYSQLNLGVRPIYHWGKSESFEWYTGVRMGFSFWTAKLETTDPYYKDDFAREDHYAFQVLFGSRAYFTPEFGVAFDLAIFDPYFVSLGICMRLSGKIPSHPPVYELD